MRLSKSSNNAVLAALFILICTVSVCAGQSTVDGGEKEPSSNSNSFGLSNSDMADDNLSGALHRMIVGVSLVVVLGIAAIYASKKVLPKLAQTQGKKIKVVETVHLGARKSVHLLDIGGQQILIGSTPDRISKLADVIDVLTEKDFPLNRNDSSGGNQ